MRSSFSSMTVRIRKIKQLSSKRWRQKRSPLEVGTTFKGTMSKHRGLAQYVTFKRLPKLLNLELNHYASMFGAKQLAPVWMRFEVVEVTKNSYKTRM